MNWLSVLWRGLVIGVADIIPGVSGGTIALLTGIYDRFINALRELTRTPKLLFDIIRRKTSFKQAANNLDWQFLVPLIIGILSAILVASLFIPSLMNKHPAPTFSFFVMLILAASIGLLRAESHKLSSILSVLLGVALGALFGLLAPTTITHGPIQLLIAGSLAISAMLLPGISGSAVLLILGHYAFILEALHTPIQNITVLASFGAGILIGLLVITRIISKLLRVARLHTISALTGLMIGALIMPVRNALVHVGEEPIASILFAIIGLGVGTLLLLSHNADQLESAPQK